MLPAFDIDGTLTEKIANYAGLQEFRGMVLGGAIKPHIAAAAFTAVWLPRRACVFVTSRPESLRAATQVWLSAHYPHLVGPLFMRADGDEREAWQVKRDLIADLPPIALIDDDADVEESIRAGDSFFLAPREWSRFVDLINGDEKTS